MSDFIKILTRKNSLRKNIQELDTEALEKVVLNLNEFIEEKRVEEDAISAEQASKKAKIDEIRKAMEAAGINPDELLSLIPEKRAKVAVKAKYRVEDDEGNVYEWSGRGRTPAAFQKQFDEGYEKNDFLIADA